MVKLTSPTANVARCVENILFYAKDSTNWAVIIGGEILSRVVSLTAFPISVTIELLFKRIPKLIYTATFSPAEIQAIKLKTRVQKVEKFALGALFSFMGIISSDGVSGLFLKTIGNKNRVSPFGVEEVYGKEADVRHPTTVDEIVHLVQEANDQNRQISIIGSGMSQGIQTIPGDNGMVLSLHRLNQMTFAEDCVKVQAGATWEQVQIGANERGLSVIVKQASDVFSIGGSIGINCHGWAHEDGALASTVQELEVIDASGTLKTLRPEDEEFGCYFGTLGYFGVVVSATLRLTKNEHYIEQTEEVGLDEFVSRYETSIKGHDIPLFGGRLVLDQVKGDPLRNVCMVRYEKDHEKMAAQGTEIVRTENFLEEPSLGTRIERISLQAIGHLSRVWARGLLSLFWKRERATMLRGRHLTRNEALHPPIKAFMMFKNSQLHTQWLQEFFIKKDYLADFLRFFGRTLKQNDVRLINATIRPTPKDNISILPYAEEDRFAVVICFDQLKTNRAIERTRRWIESVNQYVIENGDVYYQAYMPYATLDQFNICYGEQRIDKLRALKAKYDPQNRFGNQHTRKYFDKTS